MKERKLQPEEERLRREPHSNEAARRWAKALKDAGDPRGRYLQLTTQILEVMDCGQRLSLSQELAVYLSEHRSTLVDRSGGFPYRSRWRGRHWLELRCGFDWPQRAHRLPKKQTPLDHALEIVRCIADIQSFAVSIPEFSENPPEELVKALGAGRWNEDSGSYEPKAQNPDPQTMVGLAKRLEGLICDWEFRIKGADGCRLPFQEAAHFPHPDLALNRLSISCDVPYVHLLLRIPLETGEESFASILDWVQESVPGRLRSSAFYWCVPAGPNSTSWSRDYKCVFDEHGRPVPRPF